MKLASSSRPDAEPSNGFPCNTKHYSLFGPTETMCNTNSTRITFCAVQQITYFDVMILIHVCFPSYKPSRHGGGFLKWGRGKKACGVFALLRHRPSSSVLRSLGRHLAAATWFKTRRHQHPGILSVICGGRAVEQRDGVFCSVDVSLPIGLFTGILWLPDAANRRYDRQLFSSCIQIIVTSGVTFVKMGYNWF